MNLSALLLGVVCMHVGIAGYSQKVTVSRENAMLRDIFKDIRDQTGYDFFYKNVEIDLSVRKTIRIQNMPLVKALKICLDGTGFNFKLSDEFITIEAIADPLKKGMDVLSEIRGKVVDTAGNPLADVTVKVHGTKYSERTNLNGEFSVRRPKEDVVLVFTYVGYQKKLIGCDEKETDLNVIMKVATMTFDEVIVIPYGTSTPGIFTGNAFQVKGGDIANQSVSNPLEVLAGRVPGLTVTAANGMPSANLNLEIRGKGSLAQGTQPLYVIDGIPVLLDRGSIGQVAYLNNQDPFNTINPADIESIEVLKDASATAIYGSQGANGVVLINTKNNKPVNGKPKSKVEINTYYGISRSGRSMPVLNGRQYLAMRREAFRNDNVVPTISDAPDLLLWDTARYTDWRKELIGGNASTGNFQASASGGTAGCQYFVSGDFYRTTTVFPDDKPFNKATVRSNLNLISADKKLKGYFSMSYGTDVKRFPGQDITGYIFLPPDAPAMLDSNGNLKWNDLTNGIDNPYSSTRKEYSGQYSNLTGNTILQYSPAKQITLKANMGYEQLTNDEYFREPIAAQRPSAVVTGSLIYGDSKYKSWVIEPQMLYHAGIGRGGLDVLAGISWQKRQNNGLVISGTGYKDDDLLGNISAAAMLSSSNYALVYKYNAVFGRLSYNLSGKYLIEVNIRRDGSSRFGPANKFSTFGAVGAAWVFTEESWFSNKNSCISFGKLQASAGVTGNDQIGDYRYYDTWSANNVVRYDSTAGLLPQQLFNPKLQWERNIKREIGISLGFLKDKYLLSVSYYNNVSNNQLINYTIAAQTGFNSMLKNLDAAIRNSGFEFEFNSRTISTSNFGWTVSANLTIPRNKLIRYPGLQQSTDLYKYKIGEPLSVQFGFKYAGVDASTGTYTFTDINGHAGITYPGDVQVIGNRDKKIYGGIQNTIRFKNLECIIFMQFIKQTGYDWFTSMRYQPGQMWNQPEIVMNRWQKQDDRASIQAWSNATYTPQSKAFTDLQRSSASLVDASFLRLKSARIAYAFKLPQKSGISKLKVYIQGQNLITLTGYKGPDPEIQSLTILPLLMSVVGGIQVVF